MRHERTLDVVGLLDDRQAEPVPTSFSMLIAQADLDQDSVVNGVVAYRKMTVREAVPDISPQSAVGNTGDGADVIELALRHPGRPSNQRAAS